MRIKHIWIIIGIIFVLLLAAYFLTGGEVQAPTGNEGVSGLETGSTTENGTTSSSSSSTADASPSSSVNVYLIALSGSPENPGTGPVGCGDATVAVKEDITPTTGVLKAALDKLFTFKDQNVKVGSSTYYNALYQSNLKVDSAAVVNGVATVKLSGTTQLGGECDDPRVIAQLKQTVMQFSTVKQADIFINNTKLEDYFSLK